MYKTPKVERLIVLQTEYYIYNIVDSLLISLSQYLHLIFQYPHSKYNMVLEHLIKSETSFHTMIFEVEKGM
jgi:hypothetical protein